MLVGPVTVRSNHPSAARCSFVHCHRTAIETCSARPGHFREMKVEREREREHHQFIGTINISPRLYHRRAAFPAEFYHETNIMQPRKIGNSGCDRDNDDESPRSTKRPGASSLSAVYSVDQGSIIHHKLRTLIMLVNLSNS